MEEGYLSTRRTWTKAERCDKAAVQPCVSGAQCSKKTSEIKKTEKGEWKLCREANGEPIVLDSV